VADIKIFDDSSEDETSASSSCFDSDYDESMEQFHKELTRKEIAKLEVLKAIESQSDIDFVLFRQTCWLEPSNQC
jgi:hypothetical protein